MQGTFSPNLRAGAGDNQTKASPGGRRSGSSLVAGRTVAGAALAFCCWIGDRLELAAGSLAGARRGPPVVASSRYGQELKTAPGVLARQATGQAPGAVHADGALRLGSSVAISPDGKHIVSGSWDKTVKIWDSTTGKEVNVLLCHRPIVCCCVHWC